MTVDARHDFWASENHRRDRVVLDFFKLASPTKRRRESYSSPWPSGGESVFCTLESIDQLFELLLPSVRMSRPRFEVAATSRCPDVSRSSLARPDSPDLVDAMANRHDCFSATPFFSSKFRWMRTNLIPANPPFAAGRLEWSSLSLLEYHALRAILQHHGVRGSASGAGMSLAPRLRPRGSRSSDATLSDA